MSKNATSPASNEARQLRPGVVMLPLRTPTLPPATHTNAYILGNHDCVVVDPATPYEDEQMRLLDSLREFCRGQVRAVWLTHHHTDHIGAARWLAARLSVPVVAHRLTAELLPAGFVDVMIDDEMPLSIEGGQMRWEPLHTPGHAAGHLCFYNSEQRLLLSGDNVVGVGSVLVAPPPDGDMALYLASLRRMATYAIDMMLPAHGPPITDPQARIQAYIDHRLARETSIFNALLAVSGPAAVNALVDAVYQDVPQQLHGLAAMSVRAHLAKLVDEGRVRIDAATGGYGV